MQAETNETNWYRRVAATMEAEGDGSPHLVIDLDRLEANARTLRGLVPAGMRMRLVQKSLPSMPLLRHLAALLETKSLMVFHRPFMNTYAERAPEFDLLLGKPMPVVAARTFYQRFRPGGGFDPEQQLQWLIDTDARLAQYQELARSLAVRLSVSIELDVGLHRGGLVDPEEVTPLLRRIADDPGHLRLSGFMGYDAHTAKAPPWVGRERAVAESNGRYRGFLDILRHTHPDLYRDDLCLNGAGSPSVTLHRHGSPLNDISFGSALVKPTDFDLPTLTGLQPAALIAAPILKVRKGVQIPFLEGPSGLMGRVKRGLGQSVFIYGGHWMAQPVWPAEMQENSIYGLSSNHQMMNLPSDVEVHPDDVSLWRPTQSEAVMLQFGDLWLLRGGPVVDRWPVDT
jgi:D-serine deaminase-like pyridoxal phosphate-dependent protein